MDSTKQGSSESSSDENDHHKPEKVNVRSYDCAFCKRGFTNAQALGGHMNIHRKEKEKAKAKKVNITSDDHSSSTKSHKANYGVEDHCYNMGANNNCKYFSPVSSDHHHAHYYGAFGSQVNYQRMYFREANPSFFPHDYEFSSPHGSYMGENLTLRIGPALVGDGEDQEREDGKRNSTKVSEVDLELRLGHNP